MAGPTTKEKELLVQFRSQVSDLKLYDDSDMFLLRWIRARDNNLNQAETLLRNHIDWRKDNDIENILKWKPPAEIVAEYPVDIIGYDDDNCPVVVIAFGRWDIRKFVDRGQRDDFIRYVDRVYVKTMDMMVGRVNSQGVPVTQFVLIYDMDKLSMRTLTSYKAVDALLETTRRFEENHPETLKKCFVVNASRIYSLLFALIKPFTSQRTLGKIQVFGSGANKWKSALLEAVPADILPVLLGGNNSKSIINNRKKNVSEIEKENDSDSNNSENFESITMKPGEKFAVDFDLTAQTELSWAFKADDQDVGFSLLHDGKDQQVKCTPASQGSAASQQEGLINCSKSGKYSLVFHNTAIKPTSLLYKVSAESGSSEKQK